jgi:enoyl-CoA hydratase/carnithine racemase
MSAADPSFTTIAFTRDGAVARVLLSRPSQLNAITPGMLDDFARLCDLLEADSRLKVLVLTGAGRAFCAGADLAVVAECASDPEAWRAFNEAWHRVFDRIECLPQVVVAGVHGLALAGGLELTLVCDLVVADAESRLGDQHANFGLIAGGGASYRLPSVVGPRRAKELMLLGGWLTAAQALTWGLVNRVAPAGELARVLDDVARDLASKSGPASRAIKELVNRAADGTAADALERERAAIARHLLTADAREGLRAFGEKRRPVFP